MDESPNSRPATTPFGRAGRGGLLLAAAPLAAAIGVFGVIFGAAASTQMDAALALGMSLLVFSGTLQFATLGLAASGAGIAAILLTAFALNLRHVVLGAVLRPRIDASPLRRAVMSWFLLDESFGLALASGRRAATALLASGVFFYAAWVGGTVLGLLGARLVAVEGLAAALFPVLFVGLTALTVRGREGIVRAVVAAAIVLAVSLLLPELHAYVPIVAAFIVALPGTRRR